MKEASWQQSSKAYKQASNRALMHQSKQRTDIQWIQRYGQAKQANKQCSDEESESIITAASKPSKLQSKNNKQSSNKDNTQSHQSRVQANLQAGTESRSERPTAKQINTRATAKQRKSKATQSKEKQSKTNSDSKANQKRSKKDAKQGKAT